MSDILLENVSCHFGAAAAVDSINLEVKAGEFLTLLGPSGCGKTTTLRMIAGLERNSRGRILIGSEVVSDAEQGFWLPPERRRLGMVFQSYAIWPHMTVFDNVAYPLRIRRRPTEEIRQSVARALRLVEMEEFASRPAPALSGGQQQRVAIARALVFEPRVLLLDEPLSNLDARLRLQTGEEFRALQQRLGITSLYVTHDQNEAMALSDRIVVMQAGRIQQIGSPEDLYHRPVSLSVARFFGTPNVLEATVVSTQRDDHGRAEVEVEGQGFRGNCRAAQDFAPGQRVVVVLRPEDLRFSTGDTGMDVMRWSGEVVQTVFRGPYRSYTIRTPSGAILLDGAGQAFALPGSKVTIEADRLAGWVLPA